MVREKGIACNTKMQKKALIWNQYKPTSRKDKFYRMDQLLKRHGHEVVCLLPYMCEFNPIDLIWAKVKCIIHENNVHSKFSLQALQLWRTEAVNCYMQRLRRLLWACLKTGASVLAKGLPQQENITLGK